MIACFHSKLPGMESQFSARSADGGKKSLSDCVLATVDTMRGKENDIA